MASRMPWPQGIDDAKLPHRPRRWLRLGRVARTDTLSVVEAAYASAPSDAEWLSEVARAATSALGAELGAVAWFMDFLPGVDAKPRCEGFVRVGGCDDRVVTYLSSRHELTFPEPVADLVYVTAYGHGRSLSGARELMGPLFDLANPNGKEETGAPDCLALQCFDAARSIRLRAAAAGLNPRGRRISGFPSCFPMKDCTTGRGLPGTPSCGRATTRGSRI